MTINAKSYNRSLLVNGLVPETQFIRGWDAGTLAAQRAALACDDNIPANCIGYVSQLISDGSTPAVRTDAARQLSRFVSWEN